MPSKKSAGDTKSKVNVKDLEVAEAADAADATLFVAESTMLTLPNGHANHGDFLTIDDLGDMKDIHLERGAIRPATHEEQVAYDKKANS